MIALILISLAAICKAVMDTLQFHYEDSAFKGNYWNPIESWKNKYKPNSMIPKFFGSTTFLVWTTDGWHLFQMLFLTLMFLGIVLYHPVIEFETGRISHILDGLVHFIGYRVIFGLIFELFYSKILVK